MTRWIGPVIAGIATAFFIFMGVTSDGWATFWFFLLAIGGTAETIALSHRAKGDTLSETVWDKTDSRVPRVLLGIFLAWLSWHFVVQNPDNEEDKVV